MRPLVRQINRVEKDPRMRKTFASMCLIASLSVLAAPSYAMGWFPNGQDNPQEQGNSNSQGNRQDNSQGQGKSNSVSKSVPEIDGAGAILALALLGGIVAIARERRKKQ